MGECFTEDEITVLRDAFLELLLEVPAAMLVLAERWDLPLEVLEASPSEAVD
jgi:hypothetical protein